MSLRQLSLLGLSLFAGHVACKGPFLTQVDTQTWVFGNDLWNLTEGKYYATKLFSSILPGHDLVGAAAGHYAGIGETSPALTPAISQEHDQADSAQLVKRWRKQF